MEKSQINHLGFIVDGNRRWAKEQNLPTLKGHQEGLKKVELIIEELAKTGRVNFASFYLFSTENWNRTKEEVGYLMDLLLNKIIGLAQKMAKNNVKCVIIGSEQNVPDKVLAALKETENITKDCTGMTVGICFNYGGQLEIADAAKKLAESGAEFTVENLAKNLYHPEVPPCDMIVRTSGEERISGFMLWRAAYAEFFFLEKYWPDIDASDVEKIFAEYESRNRRFGK